LSLEECYTTVHNKHAKRYTYTSTNHLTGRLPCYENENCNKPLTSVANSESFQVW